MAKKKKWIQAASASIKKRGTEGVCKGPKFGGPTCPPGSKRYNLAKVFKGMAKKKKKAAWGSMIHAKDSKYIQTREHAKKMELLFKKYAVPRKKATGAMIHAKKSKYIQGTASAKDILKNIDKTIGVLPPAAKKPGKKATGAMIHAKKSKYIQSKFKSKYIQSKFKGVVPPIMHSEVIAAAKKRKHATGAMIHAKTSTFAETHASNWAKRRAAATTGMKMASITKGTKGTTSMAKLVKGLKNVLGVLPAGAAASKWSKIPKASQLKTLTKVGGRRSLMLMGGPMGAAAAAATLTPSLINKLTKRAPGAKKTKLFGIDIKGAEKSARSREALMAKRNKARNAKTGAMIKATHGIEVLGKQSVPFESQGATANLAAERQGRKGAAVRGFNFKGVF